MRRPPIATTTPRCDMSSLLRSDWRSQIVRAKKPANLVRDLMQIRRFRVGQKHMDAVAGAQHRADDMPRSCRNFFRANKSTR
jgi:hypothetical protein